MPKEKKQMMRDLSKKRTEQGLKKVTIWMNQDEEEKVRCLVKSMRCGINKSLQ